MKTNHLRMLPFAMVCFIACSGALCAQAQERRQTPYEINERSETQRLARSSKEGEREHAVDRLAHSYMDYSLLWQLMNDTAPRVRAKAIRELRAHFTTAVEDRPLSAELAQKMAALFETALTPESIYSAYEPGRINDMEADLVTASALSLDYLYQNAPLAKSPADHAAWQQRVLGPVFFATAGGSGSETTANRHTCLLELFRALSEPTLLKQALPVLLQKLEDPALSSLSLRASLQVLWGHPLLGHGRPLHRMLLTQIAPRLESLHLRILGHMPAGEEKLQATLLFGDIAEAIRTADK